MPQVVQEQGVEHCFAVKEALPVVTKLLPNAGWVAGRRLLAMSQTAAPMRVRSFLGPKRALAHRLILVRAHHSLSVNERTYANPTHSPFIRIAIMPAGVAIRCGFHTFRRILNE